MTYRSKVIMALAILIALLIFSAFQLRYKTYDKPGYATAVFDRWTGVMRLCDGRGCYTDAELRKWTEEATLQETREQGTAKKIDGNRISIETKFGTILSFKGGTPENVIKATVSRLDLCAKSVNSQISFDTCYRPTVDEQSSDVYKVERPGIYDPLAH